MSSVVVYAANLSSPEGHAPLSESQITMLKNELMARHAQITTMQLATCVPLSTSPLTSLSPSSPSLSSLASPLHAVFIGSSSAVEAARGDLLRMSPLETKTILQSIDPGLLHSDDTRKRLYEGLARLARETQTQLTVQKTTHPHVLVYGSANVVEQARVRILVFLDQMMNLRTDTLQLPYHLHNLVAGRKHHRLFSIMEDTVTNIYLQSPFATSSSHSTTNPTSPSTHGVIYITGDPTGIQKAKESLQTVAAQKMKTVCHKTITMQARKLDWMIVHQHEELRSIMTDNGSFIAFPMLGSGSSTVTVYAENRTNVERTLRLINHMATRIYKASFYVRFESTNDSDSGATLARPSTASHHQLSQLISWLSQNSNAEVNYNVDSCQLEVFGTQKTVGKVYQLLSDMPSFKLHHQFTVFALELATTQREFISGKKNGKINKIMKMCTARIKFASMNEYNFVIKVESDQLAKAVDGLVLIQDELPAELSFHVPEIYHRRIIGVGGKNIQRVMKRYGVYVKFSGAEEFASLGGYFENDHNVVARTPMKNQTNLVSLRQAVMDFIAFPKDRDFIVRPVAIPSYLHRTFLHQHGSKLRELALINNTKIEWPERSGKDEVCLLGPRSHIGNVRQYLEHYLVHDDILIVPTSVKLAFDPADSFMNQIRQHILTETRIELLPPLKDTLSPTVFKGDEPSNLVLDPAIYPLVDEAYIFRFRYTRDHEKALVTAKRTLEQYLRMQQPTTPPAKCDPPLPLELDITRLEIQGETMLSSLLATSDNSTMSLPTHIYSTNYIQSLWMDLPKSQSSPSPYDHARRTPPHPLRTIFETTPSPPPSRSTSSERLLSNFQSSPDTSMLAQAYQGRTERYASSVFTSPTNSTGKNIWATPGLKPSKSTSTFMSRESLDPMSLENSYSLPLIQPVSNRNASQEMNYFAVRPRPVTSLSASTAVTRTESSYRYPFFGHPSLDESPAEYLPRSMSFDAQGQIGVSNRSPLDTTYTYWPTSNGYSSPLQLFDHGVKTSQPMSATLPFTATTTGTNITQLPTYSQGMMHDDLLPTFSFSSPFPFTSFQHTPAVPSKNGSNR
ncbi:uncharacterized protein BYT42DRAFT_604031 [Radiomyces spectabilis]|uniref:uncharacterized protein n=1 Tax=Radiomyces spectabilis TaxID=64574 RepID=UPI00221E5B49|nr:uncharacterized protein BYT42DRAFT_604031 [Radiomyces spectabilis]KAI8380973.1 hypothetical protein BYT42DRAFT_604031 [Radiomyces spectabilis]